MRCFRDIFIICAIFIQSVLCEFMYEPSFISDWYDVQAGQQSSSSLDIPHNLGQYPVKMDVQVKITEGGKEYIFSGIGSSQRDDDISDDFGAVIYRYNYSHVQIGFPYITSRGASSLENVGLAYTGAGTLYDGPSEPRGPYTNGQVRVRAWLATDMPEPVFNISAWLSNLIDESYQEVSHGLGFYPDIVTVQTKMEDGYMSDGMDGSRKAGDAYCSDESGPYSQFNGFEYAQSGGVVFGYDNNKVRLWTTYDSRDLHVAEGVFFGGDGYTLGKQSSGTAIVLGWRILTSQQVFHSKQSVGGTNSHDSVVRITSSFDWRNYLVSVQYKIPSGNGPNGGMVFYAAGTTQASTQAEYGGIVYAYTNDSIVLWTPKGKPVVYIGGMWGNSLQSQTSDIAEVIVKIFHLRKQKCPLPEIPNNASFIMSGQEYTDTLNYTCNPDHVFIGGNLLRSCARTRQWTGFPPTCIDRNLLFPTCNNTRENNLTDTELQGILANLRIDKKNTSAYRRTKSSAKDDRLSVRIIGMGGAFIIVSFFAFFIIPDTLSILRYVCCRIKKA